jgi:hypothetical protein
MVCQWGCRGQVRTRWARALGTAVVMSVGTALALAAGGCGRSGQVTPTPSPTPEVLTITETGMVWVDSLSTDGRWLVGSEPRDEGSDLPKPLVRVDRQTGAQTVLCDWADPTLGYCSLAEQGGMIPESPTLLLELVDDTTAGWFPSGGVFVVDTATGERRRVDTDSSGEPLVPAWQPTQCDGGCDYHAAPYLAITQDAVSGDGRMAAFCANYAAPREPVLYVKDLGSGTLTRTGLHCGVLRFGREDDHDEFNDEGMSGPQVSADGTVVHLDGDRSLGGEYGRVGWQADTLYFTATGEHRSVAGSGGMTRDGRTVLMRSGVQPEVPEDRVVPAWVAYDVASGASTPLPWMQEFVTRDRVANATLDTFEQASADGRLVLNDTAVRDVASGTEVDIASLLRERGYAPTSEWGPLRISGDGRMIVAAIHGPDPQAEADSRVLLVTGWGGEPVAAGASSGIVARGPAPHPGLA